MEQLFIRQLDYEADGAALFERIRSLPYAVFLDSNRAGADRPLSYNRYDIVAAAPRYMLRCKDGVTTVEDAAGEVRECDEPPLDCLRRLAPKYAYTAPYPFVTGWIGFFSYDFGRRIETLETRAQPDGTPDFMFGLYDWAVVSDHATRRCTFIACHDGQGGGADEPGFEELIERLRTPVLSSGDEPFEVGELSSNMDVAAYAKCIDRIKRYIHDGDCYQVNFAQRFSAPVSGDVWGAYKRLRGLNPAPFAAYLDFKDMRVMSISPERFLHLSAGRAETRPIKGTIARQRNSLADRCALDALAHSEKDRAENLMIVDLMRNDLGRACRPGSITVDNLFGLESFANVHHMVSTVTGQLRADCDGLELVRHCFPGGSVTGAPRLRAMEIIEELEPHRRGVYCGAIGYISRNGDLDLNIAIRTMVERGGVLSFHGGGGIVADSNTGDEYRETLAKVSSMTDLLSDCRARAVAT